jgi:hypothetical protein
MKNLLERAKPELRQAIESFRDIYPNWMEKLENRLKENSWITNLTYEDILNIRMVVRDNDLPFDMMNPWAYFEDDK